MPVPQALQGGGARPVTERGADEAPRRRVLRVGEHRVHVAVLHHAPAVHHRDPVAQVLHDVHLVRDHDDGDPELAVHAAQQVQHVLRGLGVQRRRRLVREQDARPCRERPCDADPLLLPTGQLGGVGARLVLEPDEAQQLGHTRTTSGAVPTGHRQRVPDVARDGARAQQVELLEDHADPEAYAAQLGLRQRRDVPAADDDAPARRGLQRVDQAHQCRLAGARVADDAEDLPGGDVERDVVDGADGLAPALEDLADAAQAHGGPGRGGPTGGGPVDGGWCCGAHCASFVGPCPAEAATRRGIPGSRRLDVGGRDQAFLASASTSVRICWSSAGVWSAITAVPPDAACSAAWTSGSS